VFESSLAFLLFDYLRIPYQVVSRRNSSWLDGHGDQHPLWGCGELAWDQAAVPRPALRWPQFDGHPSTLRILSRPGEYHLGSVRIYGRVLPDDICGQLLNDTGMRWRRSTPIRDQRGREISAEWRGDDGSRFLPYDPGEVIRNYWSEAYREISGRRLRTLARRMAGSAYYRVRPILPRQSQIAIRRLLSKVQARTRFPAWPVEMALHDFYDLVSCHVTGIAAEAVPWLAPWPDGYSWTFVLTHDVETSVGYRNIHVLRDLEAEFGYRSSWNFVPKRYTVDDAVVDALQRDGFEVGIHGLYHDGRDLASLQILTERIPVMREYASRWRAVGFRSPATHRNWAWMPLLGFDYDSSYPDTDPFEPQAGGCCSWLPYFNEDLVELPISLPQDHTLFTILEEPDGRMWVEKADRVRGRGGMALMITHPDYMQDHRSLGAYRTLLQRFADDPTVWRALPSQVSSWWRRRAASELQRTGSGWRVVGPAADEARIAYATSSCPRR
jgi:peptidoglycan/xylan/chitin deacetylase (PgdA/CDA1 family)